VVVFRSRCCLTDPKAENQKPGTFALTLGPSTHLLSIPSSRERLLDLECGIPIFIVAGQLSIKITSANLAKGIWWNHPQDGQSG
jgi:hypothetical protein